MKSSKTAGYKPNRFSSRIIFAFACTVIVAGAQTRHTYDSDFFWGAAISAHQVEGAFGGGVHGDWWWFEHFGNNILNGDTADIATDHWHRYQEDFALAKAMGVNSIRTSVAWEKIEPAPGIFDAGVIAHYRVEFERMRSMGLRPLITLQHGTVPMWFQLRGGWLADDSPQIFLRYADHVVQSLGDLCDLWATINEPSSLIGEGYVYGRAPPQIKSPGAAIVATVNVIRAHRLATARIHELQPHPSSSARGARLRGVGLVSSLEIFDPFRPGNASDIAAAAATDEIWNWALIAAAVYSGGALESAVLQLSGAARVPPAEVEALIRRLKTDEWSQSTVGSPVADWLGVNFYTRNLIEAVPNGEPVFHTPPGPVGDNGWSVYPEGLERIIRAANQRFPSLPIIVTEHGMADARDRYRPDLIREGLRYLDRAKSGHNGLAPVDVRGYYHWSLTDNFEWRSGYAHRFGLVAIVYDPGQKRVPRPSSFVYANEIRERR